jgi:tetratricopeptide (TPR) repeat protein
MIAAAWFARRRRPVVALGIAWFLAAHALTATIVPLELVFEHRNYFASLGLLLATGDLLLPRERAQQVFVRRGIVVVFIALCAAATLLRAVDWGDPVRLAYAEASLHPESPRAMYEVGRVLTVLSNYDASSPLVSRAIDALDKAANVRAARTQPDAALIVLASRTHRPVEAAWWERLLAKLRASPPSVSDSEALMFMTECVRRSECTLDRREMVAAFVAAVSHEPPDAATLYAYAIYAYNALGDTALALELARDAVAAAPRIAQYRINLARFLIDLGQFDAAATEIATLRSENALGALTGQLAALDAKLGEAKRGAGGNPTSDGGSGAG